MAYVKVMFRTNANKLIQYAFKEKAPEDPVHSSEGIPTEEATKQAFEMIRKQHKAEKGIQAVHVIQSWSPEESKRLSRDQVNKMGQELAARYFEGHQYLVVTHSHDEHHHNHIVVNSVAKETGQRITNKKKHLYKLREISDQICRENGLSVIDGDAKERRSRMPDRVDRIERYNGNSYIYAMKDKAQFARHYATNFDEYAGYLDALGVGLRIKEKTITYFYEDKAKGKRGDKLGREFTKDGLEEAFKRNHDLFSAKPELRARIRSEFERAAGLGRSPVRDSGGVLLDGRGAAPGAAHDAKAYTASSRAHGDRCVPSADKLRNSIIPVEAIHRARSFDIGEYCKRNKIELTKDDKGRTVLAGRAHVVIEGDRWTNTKNRTKGGALEFAAIHGNLTYLQAISKVNGVPSLLELERHFGEVKRKFTSFHVPRAHEASYPEAIERMGRFLTSFGAKREAADALLRSDQARVGKNGIIRVFPAHDNRNALEFEEDRDGTWSAKRKGQFKSPFYSSRGSSDKMLVFSDPKHYIEKRGHELFDDRSRKHGILVLMEPSHEAVADHLKANPHVKDVEIVSKSPSKPAQGELDFFDNLKTRLRGLGVNVKFTEYEKALMKRGSEIEL